MKATTYEYTILNDKVFIPVKDGVVILYLQDPFTRRFIHNDAYDIPLPPVIVVWAAVYPGSPMVKKYQCDVTEYYRNFEITKSKNYDNDDPLW